MLLRVIGCHGGETPKHRTSAFVLDERLAIDAGSLTSGMDLKAQCKLEAVLVSHAHLDHIRDLATLADNRVQNGCPPLMIAGVSKSAARAKADELLGIMGLAERGHHQPAQMSGGEQQRVAIARALANTPRLVIADEPTGNLDPATTERVFATFIKMAREEGAAVLVATHNFALVQHMDRVLTLKDGKIVPYVAD